MFVDQIDESCIIPLNESKESGGRLELANSGVAFNCEALIELMRVFRFVERGSGLRL
jgi:hypothetical protein